MWITLSTFSLIFIGGTVHAYGSILKLFSIRDRNQPTHPLGTCNILQMLHWQQRAESVRAQNSSIIHTVYRGWNPMHEAHSGPEITYGFICIRCFCLLRNATLKLMKFLQKISGRLWTAPSHSSNRFEPRSHYLPHASPTLRLQTGAFPLRLTVIVASSIATAIKSLHISRYDYASTHHDSKGHFWHNGPSPQRTGWWWYWLSDL